LSRAIGVHLLSEVFVAKWVTVNGVNLVISGKSEDSFPVFQQIVYIITMGMADIKLVTASWDTVKFDRHTHTYVVKPTESKEWSITTVQNLFDHQTYHASKSYKDGDNLGYVTLRHKIP
jgi:hypothetical protein